MDQFGPWQVVPRQVFTPYDCLLISVVFVVLCQIGLWVTGVIVYVDCRMGKKFKFLCLQIYEL